MTIPEFRCYDCGVNTCPLEGGREYYEVHDYLWMHDARAPGIGQADHGPEGYFLCVGCLEARVGRELKPGDFKSFPANLPSPWLTDRLNNRLDGLTPAYRKLKSRADAQQFFPNALYDAVMARYRPYWVYQCPAGATVAGINGVPPMRKTA